VNNNILSKTTFILILDWTSQKYYLLACNVEIHVLIIICNDNSQQYANDTYMYVYIYMYDNTCIYGIAM